MSEFQTPSSSWLWTVLVVVVAGVAPVLAVCVAAAGPSSAESAIARSPESAMARAVAR